jgi:hypothetical protein
VEADLQRYYGVDLRDLARGRLSWRRLEVLIAHLPRESETVRVLVGDQAEWGAVEHLLAAAVDALHAANWQRSGRKGAKRPTPIRRPGDKGTADVKTYRPSRTFGRDEIDAMFGGRNSAEEAN